jgi:uncharacterized RDD family membrane protein YckC
VGGSAPPPVVAAPQAHGPQPPSVEAPAGFWRRATAWTIDIALLSPVLVPLLRGPVRDGSAALMALLAGIQEWTLEHMLAGTSLLGEALPLTDLARQLLDDPTMHALLLDANGRLGAATLQGALRVVLVAALYFAGFESSRWAATPGKRLLGLRVADLAAQRVGPGRALARFLAGSLSWLTLNLGHALAGFRRDHRALHDLVAGTQVLGTGPTPRWARLVLGAALLASVLLPLALVARMLAAITPGL